VSSKAATPSLKTPSHGEVQRLGALHACILYPSLGSPAIISGSRVLQVLLLGPANLNANDVAARLCFVHDADTLRGIKKSRQWGERLKPPLCEKANAGIKVEKVQDASAPELEAMGFKGLLHSDLLKAMQGKQGVPQKRACPPPPDEEKPEDPHSLDALGLKLKPLTQLYAVTVDLDQVGEPWRGELQKGRRFFLLWRGYLTGERQELHEQWLHAMLRDTLDEEGEPLFIGKRLQGELIACSRLSGMYPGLPGLTLQGDFPSPDTEAPLTDYHPFYVYPTQKPLNCAFMSDLHLVTKFRYLKHSGLRVVPGVPDAKPTNAHQVGPQDSPTVGGQLLDSVDTLSGHFKAIQNHPDADVLMLGGDLVDFHDDHYPEDFEAKFFEAEQNARQADTSDGKTKGGPKSHEVIWDACAIDKDDSKKLRKRFQAGAATLGLYHMVVRFVLDCEKPVVVLAGNHDAYHKPFGISPRVKVGGVDDGKTYYEFAKGNEGIPADTNLTVLEACLAFGPSYERYVKAFNFNADVMQMFYLLYTPFRTWTATCGMKRLLVLDWGDSEMMFLNQEGSLGHLPTADKASSSDDLKIVKYAEEKAKPSEVVALSHFTFACFDPQIAFKPDPKDVEAVEFDVVNGWNFDIRSPKATLYNVGSSRVNRDDIYGFLLSNKVSVSLAGHAHRAGFYRMKREGSAIQVKGYPFGHFGALAQDYYEGEPVIAVSDSAGPIPRENSGYLHRWGSQSSSWTLVTFDPRGRVADLKSIPYAGKNAKPRLAVSLDYIEIDRINAYCTFMKRLRLHQGETLKKLESGKNEIFRAPTHVKAAGNSASRAALATLDTLLSPFAAKETVQGWRDGLARASADLTETKNRRDQRIAIERLIEEHPIELAGIEIDTTDGDFTVKAPSLSEPEKVGQLTEDERNELGTDFLPNLLTTWVGEDVPARQVKKRENWAVKFNFHRDAIQLPPGCAIEKMALYFQLPGEKQPKSDWYQIPFTVGQYRAMGKIKEAGEGGEKLLREMGKNKPFKLRAYIAMHLNGGNQYQSHDLWIVPAILYFLCSEQTSRLIVIRHVFAAENPDFKERQKA
jgi:Calcineurin-like phosphoesterase